MKRIRVVAASLLLMTGTIAGAAGASSGAPVRVFDAGELTPDRYRVIDRIWTGTWRASFVVPEHDDAGAAVAALTGKAAGLGADGVVNLHCLKDPGGWGGGYTCYGLAIKLK